MAQGKSKYCLSRGPKSGGSNLPVTLGDPMLYLVSVGTCTPVVYTHAYTQVGKAFKNVKIKNSYPFAFFVGVSAIP